MYLQKIRCAKKYLIMDSLPWGTVWLGFWVVFEGEWFVSMTQWQPLQMNWMYWNGYILWPDHLMCSKHINVCCATLISIKQITRVYFLYGKCFKNLISGHLPLKFLFQSHWIGKEYYKRGPDGNDIPQGQNVPHIRVEFRYTVRTWFWTFSYWLIQTRSDELLPGLFKCWLFIFFTRQWVGNALLMH